MQLYDLAEMENANPKRNLVIEDAGRLKGNVCNFNDCCVSLFGITYRHGKVLVLAWQEGEISAIIVLDEIILVGLCAFGIPHECTIFIFHKVLSCGRTLDFAILFFFRPINNLVEVYLLNRQVQRVLFRHHTRYALLS